MKEAIDEERVRAGLATARRNPTDREREGADAVQLDDLTQQSGEWLRGAGPESDIVISSRVRLARNLADFPFISRATAQDRARIEKILHERILANRRRKRVAVRRTSRNWRRSTASSSSSGT